MYQVPEHSLQIVYDMANAFEQMLHENITDEEFQALKEVRIILGLYDIEGSRGE